MRKTVTASARHLFVVAVLMGLGMVSPAAAQESITVARINSINGFNEAMVHVEQSFRSAMDNLPDPKPQNLVEAWEIAVEGAFEAEELTAAVEAEMATQLSAPELQELHAFFSSPLGLKISAMEIAGGAQDDAGDKDAKGALIFAELPSRDPERLSLYTRMIDGLDAVDMAEVFGLNVTYSMIAGFAGASGQPISDDDILAIVRQSSAKLRETVEQSINGSTAWTYRDLSMDDLKTYVEFLETPAAEHYYQLMFGAVDRAMSAEARDFGNRLLIAMGMRKA